MKYRTDHLFNTKLRNNLFINNDSNIRINIMIFIFIITILFLFLYFKYRIKNIDLNNKKK